MDRDRFIRRPEVARRLGISEITVSRLEKKGQFPKRRRIGARAVGWLESEIIEWISNQSVAQQGISEAKNEQ